MRSLIVALAVLLAATSGCDRDTASQPGITEPDAAGPATTQPDTTEPDTTEPGTTATVVPSTAPSTGPSTGPSTVALEWGPCGEDVPSVAGAPLIECATLAAPLDYDDPDGPSIELALIRQPAIGEGERIGSLVVNPGGPGGSGIDHLAVARFAFPADLASRFDLVSFDPRGVGASSAVACELTRDDGVHLVADDDRPAWDRLVDQAEEEVATCTAQVPGLETQVGTNNAARDLDVIRDALGDEQLTYLGFSYGTQLGLAYADRFPDRVRAFVLDGAVSPTLDAEARAGQQEAGFDAALEAFAEACDGNPNCVLRDVGATLDVIVAVRERIAVTGSFPTENPDRVLTPGELDLAILSALYAQSAWPYLAMGLRDAATGEDGAVLQALADLYAGRRPDGTYTNMVEANGFINCADEPERPSVDEAWAAADAAGDGSRWFGELNRASTGCLGIPAAVDPLEIGPAEGAAPILVIGTTGDPATPYEWAVEMADYLDSGVLYTVEGEGHTAFLSAACVVPVVTDYLVDLTVPTEGGQCVDEANTDPFPPAGESDLERVAEFIACMQDAGADVDELPLPDLLRDPSGIEMFDDLMSADGALPALIACQDLLPG